MANTLNTFFENAVSSLGIPQINDHLIDVSEISDPIDKIVKKFSQHPSIIRINKNVQKGELKFCEVDLSEVQTETLGTKEVTFISFPAAICIVVIYN